MKILKKLSLEQIKKIDCIMFFIAGIIGIIFLLVGLIAFIVDSIPHHPQKPHVQVIQEDDTKTEIITSTEFLTKLKDVYIFSVESNGIKSSELEKSNKMALKEVAQNSIRKSASDSELINLIFVQDGKEITLFQNNLFIYKHSFENEDKDYYSNTHKYNIYSVIKNDTNGDNFLDSKDDISLYISDYNGENLREISSSVYDVSILEDSLILFTEYDDNKLTYYEFNPKTNTRKTIKTIEKEVTSKSIYIY